MPKYFYIAWHNFSFGASLAADAAIVASAIFSILYALFILSCSLSCLRVRFSPGAWFLPALPALSSALAFTPLGEIIAVPLNTAFSPLYYLGEWVHPVVVGLWGAGLMLHLLLLIMRGRAIGRRLKNLKDAPPDSVFQEALAHLGLSDVELKEFAGEGKKAMPFSWGLFRRFIGLPPRFSQKFAPDERYAVYLHELTHLKNRDSLKYVLAGAVRAVFWFNPVVVLALARYKNHLEVACDRAVVNTRSVAPLAYARLLLKGLGGGGAAAAPGFSGAHSDMARRLGCILGDAEIIPTRPDRFLAAICLGLAILGLALFNPKLEGFYKPPQLARSSITFHWAGALGAYAIAE